MALRIDCLVALRLAAAPRIADSCARLLDVDSTEGVGLSPDECMIYVALPFDTRIASRESPDPPPTLPKYDARPESLLARSSLPPFSVSRSLPPSFVTCVAVC